MAAPEATAKLVTCAGPSKTFNIAGLQAGQVIVEDAALRARYRKAAEYAHVLRGNSLGMLAAEAAYDEGDAWLDALIPYLAANRDRFAAGVAEAVPGARAMPLEATYLGWVDFSGTGLDDAEVQRRLREDARIGVNAGATFGAGGACRARFNLGCPRSTIETAVGRLAEAFADLR
jgi:cystathionine beta-lyase